MAVKEIDIPFRKEKYNISPDDEICKSCGECCSDKFGTMQIIPLDFKEERIEEGLRWLMKHELLFIKLFNAENEGGYYKPLMLKLDGCYFLGKNGCLLDSGTRPIVCGHYGLIKLTKKGTPRKRKVCKCENSEWLISLMQEAYGELESWRGLDRWYLYNDILKKLFVELPDNRKAELSRSSWGTKMVNPYDSVGVIYTKKVK